MNIAEILRKCPTGTKLYSPVFGEIVLKKVDYDEEYPITCITKKGFYAFFSSDGMFFCDYSDTECMLFPSKDQRDWSKFKNPNQSKPKHQFKPFDKVLVRDMDDKTWRCDIFSYLDDKGRAFICLSSWWRQCIPYEGNEHLFGTKINPK